MIVVQSSWFVRNVAAVSVAAIAGWSSYWHAVHVALAYGERLEIAYVLPGSVDGMLLVASMVMMHDRKLGRPVRRSARVSFLAGVVASVAANIAAAHPSIGGRLVAAWPAVALLLVVEMLAHHSPAPEATEDPQPVRLPATIDIHRERAAKASATKPVTTPVTTPATTSAPKQGRPPRETRRLAEQLLAQQPELSRTALAQQLDISPRRLRQIMAPAAATAGDDRRAA
jgi:hypothetical protein